MGAVLELEITPGPDPDGYRVRVIRSVSGEEPSASFTLDLERLLGRRRDLEANVLSSAVPARRVLSDSEAAVQEVGRRLFESAFSGDILTAYRTSRALAAERGSDVQIVLRLTAPELAALPWEALYDPDAGVYVCRRDPLVRHVAATAAVPALAVNAPLRVLGLIASPRGLAPIDSARERELLSTALRPQLDAGVIEVEWIDEATWSRVHDKLLEHEWHVLHFIGHGDYDLQSDEGVLAFVGRDGRADLVSASSLTDLLDEAEPTPRLVLLNSCRSAAGGSEDLFSGTAAALAHGGIQAVAAMQYAISDAAAIEFARGFYAALAHGRGVDEAVRSGRIGILGTRRGTLEWVTPVLYLRGEDAHLFDVTAPKAPATAAAAATAEGDAATGAPTRRPAGARRRARRWLVGGLVALLVAAAVVTSLAFLAREGDRTADSGGPIDGVGTGASNEIVVPMGTAWTSTGVSCEEGDTIVISARGEGSYDDSGDTVGPGGLDTGEYTELRAFRDIESFALVARLNNRTDAVPVYNEAVYVCPQAGEMWLGPNDNVLEDNDGGFTATVTLIPAG